MQQPLPHRRVGSGRSSGRRLRVVGLLSLLALTLASCTSGPSRTSVTPSPHLASGQTAVFTSIVEVSKSGTPSVAPNGKLVALSAASGSPVWSTPTSGIAINVLFANGTLFAVLQSVPTTPTSVPPASSIEALRASDGTRLWQSTAQAFTSTIGADANAVYVLSVNPQGQAGQLEALRLADGQPIWTDSLPTVSLSGGTTAGALGDGTLFLSTFSQASPTSPGGGVTAVRASDGKTLWSAMLPGQFGALTESNGAVYVSGTTITQAPGQTGPRSVAPTMIALRASDGTQLWSHPLASQGITEGISTAVVSGSVVCVTLAIQSQTPTGTGAPAVTTSLIALNPATGAQLWQIPTPGYGTSLIGDDSAVYLSSIDLSAPATKPASGVPSPPPGALTAYRTSDGKQLWTQPHLEDSARAAAIASGTLVALVISQGSGQQITGNVEALSTSDGSKQWAYAVADGGPAAAAIGAA